MAQKPMMPGQVELRAVSRDWHRLHNHLFPGDGDEHGAVLLCGMAVGSPPRLLVRDVVLARDGIDYVPGTRGYRHLAGEFVTAQVRRARDEQLAYLAVHNHGGSTSVSFSGTDIASHERGYPTLQQVARQLVGAVVLAEQAAMGDLWLPGGTRTELTRAVITGTRLDILTALPQPSDPVQAARYHRQALLFGPAGQAILERAKVAIIRAGGVGMLLVHYLARLGVGHLVVIDPDRVEPTNLSRLPGASRLDGMEYLDRPGIPQGVRQAARRLAARKVRVAHRVARQANSIIRFEGIAGDVADDRVARLIADSDFLFLAADTMLARTVVNQIAYQYLIPTLQVGSKPVINRNTGQILDIYAVVRTLGTAPGCLSCNGLIDPAKLSEESIGDTRQVRNQRYIDDPDVHAPSVITLNAMGAGWAANDFMQFITGLGRPDAGFRILRTSPVTSNAPHVTVQEPTADPACYICGTAPISVRGTGDSRELPTRKLGTDPGMVGLRDTSAITPEFVRCAVE